MSSFEAWLTTNTERTLDEVYSMFASLPNWDGLEDGGPPKTKSHRRVCKTVDGVTTLIVIDSGNYKPGGAKSSISTLGTPRTIVLDMFIQRGCCIGRLDDMYSAAFAFCDWDETCNVLFALDDDNRFVFLRRDQKFLINPAEFYSASLARFLKPPYEEVSGRYLQEV